MKKLLAISLLVAVVWGIVVPADAMTEQHEVLLGQRVEAQFERYFDTDPQWNQRVADIGLRLAAVSERPNLPWRYHIVRDASVNAIALPGGAILVTTGLLNFINSDDELAFVLGHETTHIAHRHTLGLIERDAALQIGFLVLTQIVLHGNAAPYQLSQITRALLNAKYSRDQESEADHYGVIFAQRAGFDPAAAISFFERLQQFENGRGGGPFANHPPTADRIKAVRSELREMAPSPSGPAPTYDPGRAVAKAPPAAPQTSSVAARVVRVSIDQTVFTVKTESDGQERLLKSATSCAIYRDDQVMLHSEDGGAVRMATPSVTCYLRETSNP
jgi:predicted Zn-dependent protease